MLRLRSLLLVPSLLVACADAPLMSESQSTAPPDTTPYDPSQGGAAATAYATGGVESDTDGPPTTSDTATDGRRASRRRRCATTRRSGATTCSATRTAVRRRWTVMGSFSAEGWTVGVPMTSDGTNWTATVPVPWDTQVLYKFRVNGDACGWTRATRTASMTASAVMNSVIEPTTCEEFSCDAGLIGTFDWRDSVIYFVFVDRFENGDKGNDKLIGVESAADWQGGDWAGVTRRRSRKGTSASSGSTRCG
jgi:hypothetical protein